ncbi:hypothetical protein DIPPA_18014 [Diplonema papillatum]|nr:hypothetical protein DIPPA_18014 [Diplonema papillatum]
MILQQRHFSTKKEHPSVLTDEIISCAPDRPCVLAFRLPATRKGCVQATLRAPLTATVGEVRRQLWQQQGFELAEASVDLWLNGSRMRPEDRLAAYAPTGFIPDTIHVTGGSRELRLRPANAPNRTFSFRWSLHLTLSDLAEAVYLHFKAFAGPRPFDLSLVRIEQVSAAGERAVLPLEKCYAYRNACVPLAATLASLLGPSRVVRMAAPTAGRMEASICTVKLKRFRKGIPHIEEHTLDAEATVSDLINEVLRSDREERAQLADDGWVAGVLRPSHKNLPQAQLWDDEDEDVSPCGVRTAYMYTVDDPAAYAPTPDVDAGEPYFSFHAPPLGEPHFVSIEDDYTVPHLSDLGVVPDTILDVSFFHPSLQVWSSDPEATAARRPVPCKIHLPIGVPPACCLENEESIVIVKLSTGPSLRLPIDPNQPFEVLQNRIWCATGLLPSHVLLYTDWGRPLGPHESINSCELMPESILHCKIRPPARPPA